MIERTELNWVALEDVADARHLVFLSGGVGSWAASKRAVEAAGASNVRALFTNTMIEDESTERFLRQGAEVLGIELVEIADGRTPFEVFMDVRMLGNTRMDPCSRILKRELSKKWAAENLDPEIDVLHFGIDWTEYHRMGAVARNWAPFRVCAPLCEAPLVPKEEHKAQARVAGLELPVLYELGFPHANCGGACVKAGQAQWKLLLEVRPAYYKQWEDFEQKFRKHVKKDVAILRDRRGGLTKPLTLRALRERVQAGVEIDRFDWGGCGCFVDEEEAA